MAWREGHWATKSCQGCCQSRLSLLLLMVIFRICNFSNNVLVSIKAKLINNGKFPYSLFFGIWVTTQFFSLLVGEKGSWSIVLVKCPKLNDVFLRPSPYLTNLCQYWFSWNLNMWANFQRANDKRFVCPLSLLKPVDDFRSFNARLWLSRTECIFFYLFCSLKYNDFFPGGECLSIWLEFRGNSLQISTVRVTKDNYWILLYFLKARGLSPKRVKCVVSNGNFVSLSRA